MSEEFSFTDEESIIEYTKVKIDELNINLACLNDEIEKKKLALSRQTSISYCATYIDSACRNKTEFKQAEIGTMRFSFEQRKQIEYLTMESKTHTKQLIDDCNNDIKLFNTLITHKI